MRGGTVTLNFYDPNGHLLDYRRIEELAGLEHISLRTGCFCNPGAGETAEGLTEDDMRAAFFLRAPRSLRLTLPAGVHALETAGRHAREERADQHERHQHERAGPRLTMPVLVG